MRALKQRKECAREGAEMCSSESADKCASEGADAAKECASEGAEMCASEGAEGVKECGGEGAEGVCPRGRLQQRERNKECTGEGAVHAPARTLKECASEGADSANANGWVFIKNYGNVNFGFVTEAPTAPESMLFGMYAWNIHAPLAWFVAVEPFLFSTTGVSKTGQGILQWRGVRMLGGLACC